MRAWLTPVLLVMLAGCHHRQPVLTEIAPERVCAGQLVLEFTNLLDVPVQVGWIPKDQLGGDPARIAPVWLGVVGKESIQYDVSGPGQVIFRTAHPGAAREDKHYVRHRLLCRTH